MAASTAKIVVSGTAGTGVTILSGTLLGSITCTSAATFNIRGEVSPNDFQTLQLGPSTAMTVSGNVTVPLPTSLVYVYNWCHHWWFNDAG